VQPLESDGLGVGAAFGGFPAGHLRGGGGADLGHADGDAGEQAAALAGGGKISACAVPKLLTRVSMALRLISVFFIRLSGSAKNYADRRGRQLYFLSVSIHMITRFYDLNKISCA
jgi:hypothetical protein